MDPGDQSDVDVLGVRKGVLLTRVRLNQVAIAARERDFLLAANRLRRFPVLETPSLDTCRAAKDGWPRLRVHVWA